jgi:hypothetical protein
VSIEHFTTVIMHTLKRITRPVEALFVINRHVEYSRLVCLCKTPTYQENTAKLNHEYLLNFKRHFNTHLNSVFPTCEKFYLYKSSFDSVLVHGKSAILGNVHCNWDSVNYSTHHKPKENTASPENSTEKELKNDETDKQNLVEVSGSLYVCKIIFCFKLN